MILTRADLDSMSCSTPGCTNDHQLFFHGKCHPRSPVQASYQEGTIEITCAQCDQLIARLRLC